MPRGSAKSTFLGTIMAPWLVGCDPVYESIGYVTHTQSYSEDFVRAAKDLIDYARSNPGKLNFGSGGTGSSTHLSAEVLKKEGNLFITHIPYKGAGDAMSNLLGGQVSTMFSSPASVLPQFRAGKLRGLGVTGAKRPAVAPDLPTFAELGMPKVEVVIEPRSMPSKSRSMSASEATLTPHFPTSPRDSA